MDTDFMRDGRAPIPSNKRTSFVMRSNKRKDTSPEIKLRRALREEGLSGYRLQWEVPGRPDIAYPSLKIAIFVNGCFWHRCPKCNPSYPKSNEGFWSKKFERNIERDLRNIRTLIAEGWNVITVWECDIKWNFEETIETISRIIKNKRIQRSKYFQ